LPETGKNEGVLMILGAKGHKGLYFLRRRSKKEKNFEYAERT
jgi:hypothetical protein